MRKFCVISNKQFNIDFNGIDARYDDIVIPKRNTMYSAGYDFYIPYDLTIKSGEIVKIPTGIKVMLNSDEFLGIYIRSSLGFKYNLRMCNQVGIIESDYYNNRDNEGHMWVCLQNHGDKEYIINKGDAYAQGIFVKFLTTDDDNVKTLRTGGIGSTNKKKEGRENE